MAETTVLWFRRDLRLHDNPALRAAGEGGAQVLPVFVLDESLRRPAGAPRLAFLYRCLRALDDDLGGRLVVRRGDPVNVIPRLAAEVGARAVHIAADYGPYGAARDDAVGAALGATGLVRTGSPYAVAPGRVRNGSGDGFKVFTPFYKAWLAHDWRAPVAAPDDVTWATGADSTGVPADPRLAPDADLPDPGETAARAAWTAFVRDHVGDYDDERNRPDLDTASRMSTYLKWGTVHPRTLLADLGDAPADTAYRRQLAWREFYADVLHRRPETAREFYQPKFADLPVDSGVRADERFEAWAYGRTGYPIVDAGMRQLLVEGYIHNRVRLIVGSFLVKDLHLPWRRGARWFMTHLVDGDIASNQHNWQWVAGCGTDAAPYYRIFNPVTQGLRFDPDGDYVRRWVPELGALTGKVAHEPWVADPPPPGYPQRIVDHQAERQDALDRLATISG